MTIQTKLTRNDFQRSSFSMILMQSGFKISIFATCIIVVVGLNALFEKQFPIAIGSLASLLYIIVWYWRVWIKLPGRYDENTQWQEVIEYRFEETGMVMKGESFNVVVAWQNIKRVTKTKEWLFLWRNAKDAHVIPRRDIWDGDILELKESLQRFNIKNNL